MKSPKKSQKTYECKLCDYMSCNKKDYNKHLLTRKHQNRTILNEKSQKSQKEGNYECEHCGKIYKVRNSYWYHVKKCVPKDIKEDDVKINNETNEYKKMIATMMDKNNELQTILLEQQDKYQQNLRELLPRIGNTTNNNTKNELNFNIFLNEDCKDALNMVEFVNSLQIKMKDIENTIDSGYVNGISQIFIDGLRSLELHKRPLHCTDPINETLYIKDNNVWEIDKDKNKIKNAIQVVNKKGAEQIHNLVDNGDVNECENIISTFVSLDEKKVNTEHIIKNIVKEVTIKNDK